MDSQKDFTTTFGSTATLLHENPMNNNSQAASQLMRDYSKDCMLDIFMHLCLLRYVDQDKIDPNLNVTEVCHKIGALKQIWSDDTGCLHKDIPDKVIQ